MPRLATSLLREAYAIHPCLPLLLRPCRDLQAARNELRWLCEHAGKVARLRRAKGRDADPKQLLKRLVQERAAGKPLQYLLGTEFFGDLEIRCQPGVLIPRQETAASVMHLTRLLRAALDLPPELRVLDLCTGTGCIPLLIADELTRCRQDVQLRLLGVDVSDKALRLAQYNLHQTQRKGRLSDTAKVAFIHADLLMEPFDVQPAQTLCLKKAMNYSRVPPFWDVFVSNPPYISPAAYWKTTTRSVRGFEPKLALVPPLPADPATDTEHGDIFYPHLLAMARDVEAKIVLLEVADLAQAGRVAEMAQNMAIFDGIEIWRDQPDQPAEERGAQPSRFPIIGQGNGRSVLCWRARGGSWLGKGPSPVSPLDDARRLWESHRVSSSFFDFKFNSRL
ncbi:S-adenosyl-L-methionine-dependent methyltransferase [Amniculicola lignicola CBS 123094]|uniref:S-adenosyl-L-methionine-dependent methyltransferase n=1 Tax=Amniculicola lignicola CBS 123094 TaxID=1392246 RepID=A0A6A5WM46_9PLEO|nr:S-adenosyl-L-methionine-dependent methyltransferase [Amniculicola lignicola CBS 123094]